MRPVKINFEGEIIDFTTDTSGGDTMGDLMVKLKAELDEVDIDDWNLFHLGLELPKDNDLKLEDIVITDDEQLELALSLPPEPPRQKNLKKFFTDKTRFLVKGTKESFEIHQIKPFRPSSAALKKLQWVFKNQTFGFLTNIHKSRKIQLEMYQASADGTIDLRTDDYNNKEQIFLVEGEQPKREGDANKGEGMELIPTDIKIYDEDKILAPIEQKKTKIKYFDALLSGIATGAGVADLEFELPAVQSIKDITRHENCCTNLNYVIPTSWW